MTPSAKSGAVTRNEAIDFVKGSLVLVMVLYHWLNYFVTVDWDVYRYLRFLTPSFILVTGFLVSHVYLQKYASDDPRLRRRLVSRGLKLLVIFLALNVATELLVGGRQADAVGSWADRANAVLITGDKGAAFNILVPIGYFLLLAPFVLSASKRSGVPLSVIAAGLLLATVGVSIAGVSKTNLELLSIAFLGLAAGAATTDRVETIVRRPALLVAGYLLYLAAITVWNVQFPLQVMGVCLSVALLYFIGLRWEGPGVMYEWIVGLGEYSLFSYIAQIAILQILRRGLRGVDLTGPGALVPLLLATIATSIAVQVVVFARPRSTMIDRLYRTVFA